MSCVLVFLFALFFVVQGGIYEGESCVKDGSAGTCRILGKCQAAIRDLQRRQPPQICSFPPNQREPIVCCLDQEATTTTKRITTSTTTEYVPPPEDYENIGDGGSACAAIDPTKTAPKTGQKAWDKCVEYQEKYIYPCDSGSALSLDYARQDRCHHKTDGLIINGENADQWEFPHMVLLGFGDTPANWNCAGTIISDKFILTAGHCTFSREIKSNVTYARTGMLRKFDPLDLRNVYRISRIIKHAAYDPPRKYNDIALLETQQTMFLSEFVVPACLDVGAGVKYDNAIASGWGLTAENGQEANILQKVTLQKFTDAECQRFYRPGPNTDRNFKLGYQASTQLCYGDKLSPKDSCQGDSGGPLQVQNRKLNCMYTVVGVISFGKGCGNVGVPAIYTRVSAYIDWIERTVWGA